VRRIRRGFTLVEVMVAATIVAAAALGIYAMLIKSYQVMALGRCRDQARAVLRTYADQFLRLQTTKNIRPNTVPVPGAPGTFVTAGVYTLHLFVPTLAPTGQGLVWGRLNDDTTGIPSADVASLPITLGPPGSSTPATLTRNVTPLTLAGEPSLTRVIGAAGYMVTGTFTVTYSLIGKSYSESITVVRAVP